MPPWWFCILLGEVDLLRLDAVAGLRQLRPVRRRCRSPTRRTRGRRGTSGVEQLAVPLAGAVVAPEELAVVGRHADHAAAQELDVLPLPRDVGRDDRRVGRRRRPPGTAPFQTVAPVVLSRATSVASSPPGVQTSLSPSISGDSL